MTATYVNIQNPLLMNQTPWLIKLRWGAGFAVIALDLIQWLVFDWFAQPGLLLAVGLAILVFNAVVWLMFERVKTSDQSFGQASRLAGAQIIFDLACLAVLASVTGGLLSPVAGFFVFHMVFASMLLSQPKAYAAATAAISMMLIGLVATDHWPANATEGLLAIGWMITLLLTVYLANRLTQGLHRRENQLMAQNEEIKAMADRLRTQQETMIQHEKMVAIGRLAAGVAHEIANPVACMDSVLQLMQRNPEKPRPEAAGELREQLKRINHIVKDLTHFAHPDKGEPELRQINDIVEASLKMLSFDKRLRNATLLREYEADGAHVRIMPHAMQQVMMNLILNALDAMADQPEPRLIVRTSRNEAWCLIEIQDSGCGIGPENLPHVFEPFFTTKPVGQGTGLGLSISFNLVEEQHGRLGVSSKPGLGTTFTVRLPLADSTDH